MPDIPPGISLVRLPAENPKSRETPRQVMYHLPGLCLMPFQYTLHRAPWTGSSCSFLYFRLPVGWGSPYQGYPAETHPLLDTIRISFFTPDARTHRNLLLAGRIAQAPFPSGIPNGPRQPWGVCCSMIMGNSCRSCGLADFFFTAIYDCLFCEIVTEFLISRLSYTEECIEYLLSQSDCGDG